MNVSDKLLAAYALVATKAQALATDEKGVTAVEYGVIASLIIVVCITAITLVGTNLSAKFNVIAGAL